MAVPANPPTLPKQLARHVAHSTGFSDRVSIAVGSFVTVTFNLAQLSQDRFTIPAAGAVGGPATGDRLGFGFWLDVFMQIPAPGAADIRVWAAVNDSGGVPAATAWQQVGLFSGTPGIPVVVPMLRCPAQYARVDFANIGAGLATADLSAQVRNA